ncbi:MAG: hypothetical protein V5A49_07645 [Haloarcula sp.]
MDQLSSCYFCGGALDVSLSEYPIIPKSLDPAAEEQGTVVLCPTCREKLATIIEPAVEAAKADARETAEPAVDAGPTEPPGGLDDSGTRPAEDPTTTDNVVEPADDGSLLGNDTASAAEAGEKKAAGAATETGSEGAEKSEDSADGGDGPSLTKLEYNKVMRLLQNREMPVDRAEIREVAVNAYDIEGEQFDAIIDAAVDRDLLGQENGQLVETEG